MPRGNVISDILKEYFDEERNLEQKLLNCENLRSELNSRVTHKNDDLISTNLHLNREDSFLRNQQLLRDLEMSKARLRTLSTFSPTDQELRDIATFYRRLLRAERT